MPYYTVMFVLNRKPTPEGLEAAGKARTSLTFGAENGRPIAEYDGDHRDLVKAILSAASELSWAGVEAIEIHAREDPDWEAR